MGFRNRRLPSRVRPPALAVEVLDDRSVPSALDYSTFLGGNGMDEAYAVVTDAAGNTYVTGTTSAANYPVSAGAFDQSLDGIYDAFVAKFRPDGSRAWATYLGGSGEERGHGIAVDGAGNVFVLGRTNSTDFPTTAGSFDTTFNGGVDAFVTKLGADGTVLVYSTYLGGADFEMDEGFDALARRVGAIAVDSAGNAYVTGSTKSTDFPATAGAFRTAHAGLNDVFVSKLNPSGTQLVYSTFLGGDDNDRGHGIAVDSAGNAFVSGEAVSRDFPTTADAFQTTSGGGFSDLFVTRLNAAGSALTYSTYLGGTGSELPGRLALDSGGNVYASGSTASFDFPTTAGAFQTAKASGGFDAFVTKLNAAGSALLYSTYLGGTFGDDYGEGIAVDDSGRAYVTGYSPSGAFPVIDAFQPGRSGVNDAFVSSLNATGSALIYSSYLGGGAGAGTESGYGIAVEADGTAHVVGKTNSSGEFNRPAFPTTDDAFQTTSGGGANDAFVVRVSADVPAPPSISITDVSMTEGNRGAKRFVFTVNLSAASSQFVTVNYATADGAATVADRDYRPRARTLSFAPGETSKTITVLVNGDRRIEPNETFFVNLSNAQNATLADAQGQGTIRNDDMRSGKPGGRFLGGGSRLSIDWSNFLVSWSGDADEKSPWRRM
jgi:hypothetical protein